MGGHSGGIFYDGENTGEVHPFAVEDPREAPVEKLE
jgi:hypothetical protein